jgi:hypothetical protein
LTDCGIGNRNAFPKQALSFGQIPTLDGKRSEIVKRHSNVGMYFRKSFLLYSQRLLERAQCAIRIASVFKQGSDIIQDASDGSV